MPPQRHANKVLRVLCTTYILLSLTVQWIVVWVLQATFIVLSFPFTTSDFRQDICGHIFRKISFVGMDLLNPFWHIHVLNKFPEVKKKKVILMLNHLSAADPFMSIRSFLPRDGTWIAKGELFRVPFGGWALYNAGDLAVRFRDKKSSFATVKGTVGPMMENARGRLRRGRMLCVFPEGVRNMTPDGPINAFRLGFFSLALDEGATIVPLAVSGTEKLWPRGSAMMDAADAYFSFGEPIDAANFNSAEELAQHVWNVMTERREQHPDRVELRAAQAKEQAKTPGEATAEEKKSA
ncbi:putative mitochondrial 1-acyl-sn-glycerol-3-phosphateacyltransferase-like protein [Leptomonas pyrrhocoris]|uniref:Putative mitochondrial 1-acyl-sn-glycerol-3-phosphateacyltransferase-like protein n=1 Tax=Leptomonas pyrrhocoris TaxID=157538 RepID=A0A0N0DZ40_LEPPY|nr:putative mitochondrial 1-acyl-sn-glycerol-3-phosphateacyltransferase-like protein [Leptomonas pyrrhocoris]XP_015663202.1 putative mitochondrial 1-acyl-sn-glycerol-3-phosphateacyltransferase-like protein [Leptomonas pyrrhocoris]KPA84762.1 putative mitochondrial 1-acyl-sn-glycerol-3-phosphateacyltransferase-like protein [Leptomonas pyrrhocoris]KPA84763.1 putative mitochondrial 1-acyl-sn-glycerol-3-phosphateacyltransferase-like protein [Leptomonas pyrrhocoris]|eukprot:XP_015663201.1 putative mitochondrial 1-acyl-sn-glycerol-3-phosphateacyltransferase-like protein [Leptomonas pyrrhocoris]